MLVFRVSEHMVQQRVIVVQQLEHVLLLLCLPHDCQQNDCIGKNSSQRLCCDVGRGQLAVNYSLLNCPSEYFSIKTLSFINPAFLIGQFWSCTLTFAVSVQARGSWAKEPVAPYTLSVWWFGGISCYTYISYIYYLDQNISISAFSIIFH